MTQPDLFVATKEWQEIKAGQSIPEGLHVRLNLQTGLKEAKLLEKNVDNAQSSKSTGLATTLHTSSNVKLAPSALNADADPKKYPKWKKKLMEKEIRDALKNIKSDGPKVGSKLTPEELKKFRSYGDLKKDFDKMNLHVRTDVEIIRGLMATWRNGSAGSELPLSLSRRVSILRDFEYYLHQVDNAVNFAQLGGLDLLLEVLNTTMRNASDTALHSEALLALGSATQANSAVQIRALESGALRTLLHLLSQVQRGHLRNELLEARVVYCLSSLCRQFPLAQLRLIQFGGLEALIQMESVRARVKVLTLMYDLLMERQLALKHGVSARLQQYQKIDLVSHLVERGWCALPAQLLTVCAPDDEDTREKALLGMRTLSVGCLSRWRQQDALEPALVERLLVEYRDKRLADPTNEEVEAERVLLQLAKELRRDRDEL